MSEDNSPSLFKLIYLFNILFQAFLLNEIIAYIEAPGSNLAYSIGLILAILVANIIRAGTACWVQVFGAQTGSKQLEMNLYLYDIQKGANNLI